MLSEKFKKLVAAAGGADDFAEKYGFSSAVIKKYCEDKQKIQIGTLIMMAVVIDLKACPKCPRTTIDELKKVAISLVDDKEKEKFKTAWNEMFE